VADLRQRADRLGADALRRRVGRDELGVLGLERLQLAVQRVVLVVADLRVVEDVVAMCVVVELRAQLVDACLRVGRRAHSTSSAAGASSRERSCSASASMPVVSVRSKCSGVTAIFPAATAARSCPGSSSKPGSSP
jgi:hypothetical protein